MAIVKKTYKGTPLDCQQEFVCDYRSDVDSLPTQNTDKDKCPTGSTAFVIDDSSVWMLNSEGHWKEI